MAKFRDFQPGTRVRYSGKFLRNTGQMTGSAGQQVFTVTHVRGEYVTVDQKIHPGGDVWTPEEHAADPTLAYTRIHTGNLTIVGQLDSRDCP